MPQWRRSSTSRRYQIIAGRPELHGRRQVDNGTCTGYLSKADLVDGGDLLDVDDREDARRIDRDGLGKINFRSSDHGHDS